MSVFQDHAMQGEGKKGDFPPHTQLGTGSQGLQVSGFPLVYLYVHCAEGWSDIALFAVLAADQIYF